MAYRVAEIKNPQARINFAEVDDTYAYKELQHLEALELCPRGKVGLWMEDDPYQGYHQKRSPGNHHRDW